MALSVQLSPRSTWRHLIFVGKSLNKQPLLDKQRFFFDHYGVTENDLEHYLAAALSAGGDYADLYFEYLSSTSLMVDESMVKSASQGISAGCGVRVVSGERTGYAYTDDLSSSRILHAARTAALIASAPPSVMSPGAGMAHSPWPAAATAVVRASIVMPACAVTVAGLPAVTDTEVSDSVVLTSR